MRKRRRRKYTNVDDSKVGTPGDYNTQHKVGSMVVRNNPTIVVGSGNKREEIQLPSNRRGEDYKRVVNRIIKAIQSM